MRSAVEVEQAYREIKQKKRRKAVTVEEKQLHRIENLLGDDLMEEIRAMDLKELKTRVNACALNIKTAQDEYREQHGEEDERLKELLKELRQPLKDAIKYQEAIQEYALIRQEIKNDA